MTFLNRFKQNFSYSSIVILALGLALLIYPGTSQRVMCLLIGGALVAKGGAGLIVRLRSKGAANEAPLESVWNVLLLAMGLFVASNPDVIMAMIPYLFGLFLLVSSISSLQKSMVMREMGYEKWASGTIFALIRIALAVFIIINPFSTGLALTRFIGGCLVYDSRASAITSIGSIKASIAYDKQMHNLRDMNLSKKKEDEPIETVEAEFVDVVQDTTDVD